VVKHQVAHLARIVDDLLDLSRISNGSFGLQTRTVDLREIVQRAMQTVRSEVAQKRQSLVESLPEKTLWIRGDAVRLEQVVVNILNNANKYTERGGLIEVTLREGYEEAVLCIRDNGVGITPELLPLIFDLFTRGEQPPERPHVGLGIGLALVQRLVDMHGGRVEAHSTPGRGTEFVIGLPVCTDVPVLAGSELPTAPTPAPARPLKVLVVEDDPDVARSLGRLLQAAGHEILVAHDGVGAVQAAREFVPNIALLDIGLPSVDGFQVAKWIRAEPALSDLVLVALTGYACDSDRQRAAESGFDYYLVKPASFVDIQNMLRSATTSGAGSEG
jgi:CheY-like chemotaxis protein/two-component sensor histidine kinase